MARVCLFRRREYDKSIVTTQPGCGSRVVEAGAGVAQTPYPLPLPPPLPPAGGGKGRGLDQQVEKGYGGMVDEQLVSIVLYGSVARRQAHPASDIDLFVVLQDAPAGALRRRALVEPVREGLTSELEKLWAQGVYSDFVEVIRSQAEAAIFHLLYLDMTTEAEILYDRRGFFGQVLQGARERLAVLHAQRRQLGRQTYWDLKPGFTPGEVIEL